jgi:hypothetical protein
MSKLNLYVGQDFLNSYANREYCVYEKQCWLLDNAIKKNIPIVVSINRKDFALIKLNNKYKYINNDLKMELDKKYEWFPEKNRERNWEIYFTFEVLEEY